MLTVKEIKAAVGVVLLGGIIRLAGQLLYTLCSIKGVWYKAEILSDICYLSSAFVFASHFNHSYKIRGKYFRPGPGVFFFLLCAMNDCVDQFFFDPGSFGWNEKLFFIVTIYWFWGQYWPKYYWPVEELFLYLLKFKFIKDFFRHLKNLPKYLLKLCRKKHLS